ncbi:MAG: hypothetical protein NT098_03910 [Candidatus Parcubacteria bacterium]|nr:hypothetical protein [Candidatus Parcubacteria bacterium]
MVKKVIQDIISPKKGEAHAHRHVEHVKKHTASSHDSSHRNAKDKESEEIEDVLPKRLSAKEKKKETVMEQSPIFEKMKQRHEERESFSQEYRSGKKGKFSRNMKVGAMSLVGLLVVCTAIYGFLFYSATVTVHLKHVDISLDNKEFQAKQQSPDAVPFQIMSLSAEQTVKLTPTGEKKVTTKASGKIVVYNAYNNQPQTLIKNTRFQATDGKIFRTGSLVVVPGMKKVGGKDVPGSLEVVVFANEAGPEYNIGLVDFTIPGFKGSPRFTKFYARSKTVMTGGANGLVKIISDEDMKKAKDSITVSLRQKLIADAFAQKPKGTVLYPDAMFFTFTDTVNTSVVSGEKEVPLTIKGTVDSIIFDEVELGRRIVQTSVSLNPDEQIKIDNIEKLGFVWKTPRGNAPEKTETLEFLLSGTANAVWGVDENALKNKLSGTKKGEFTSIISQFTGVEKSKPTFNVFWRSSFPKNTEKIHIETLID